MTTDKRKPVLDDHKRKGKKLLPPILASIGDTYSPYSFIREIVPELIWISLLIQEFGFRKGIELSVKLAQLADKYASIEPKPLFSRLSSYSKLSQEENRSILAELSADEIDRLTRGLSLLSCLFPENPLQLFCCDNIELTEKQNDELSQLLEKLYDKNDVLTVRTLSIAMYIGIATERVKFTKEMFDKTITDFEVIHEYPHTEESKMAASSFRASAPMLLGSIPRTETDDEHDKLLEEFWEKVAGFGPCTTDKEAIKTYPISEDPLEKLVGQYCNSAKTELKMRLDNWPCDLNDVETHEAIGGLLARQTTLACEIAMSPGTWNQNVAPLLLRGLADVFITTAWILNDPSARSKNFIEDGLGKIKLELAHRKQQIDTVEGEGKEDLQQMIDIWEDWLNSQRMEQFVAVNLSNFSGLTVRKMAEEADCLDFYNYVYQPFSNVAHSNWSHISMFNLTYCVNPAHKYHKLPSVTEHLPDAHWLYLAAKYLNKTFKYFDDKIGGEIECTNSFDELYDLLYGQDD